MKLRRAIAALGAVFALSFGLMLAPSQAEAATVTINSRANAVEAGQILAAPDGSVFTITVYDAGLSAGQKSVTHTYVTGNTLRQTANKIVQAINADTELQAIGVTATLGTGSNYTINSTSANGTLYRQTTTGGGTNRLAIQQALTISGTVTVDDKLTLTIYDAGLVGGKEAVVYKPNTGDSLANIVIRLRNKINNNANLSALAITAKVSSIDPNTLLIDSPTFDTTEKFTSYSAKVKAGGTETMTLGNFWGTNGAQSISITGPITVGETVEFTVYNLDLPDSQKTVTYEIQNGDNLNQIRCGLRTLVNNDLELAAIGVHATCSGGVINLTSTSSNPTTYWKDSYIHCFPVNASPSQWPAANQVKTCGAATYAGLVRSTVEALGDSSAFPGGGPAPYAAEALQAHPEITWYTYLNHNDFYQSGTVPFLHDFGAPNAAWTIGTEQVLWANPPFLSDRKAIIGFSSYVPRLTLIFENSTDRHETTSVAGTYIAHQAAHETGHQFDYMGINILAGEEKYSDRNEFKNAWIKDITLLDALPPCTFQATDGRIVSGDPPNTHRTGGAYASHSGEFGGDGIPLPYGGLPGFFTEAKDYKGDYICTSDQTGDGFGRQLSTSYAGLTNLEIIAKAYPRFAPPPGMTMAEYPLAELFAEEYADLVGFPDTIKNDGSVASDSDCVQQKMCDSRIFDPGAGPRGYDGNTIFACTRLYVKKRAQENRNPTAQELHDTGYTIPDEVPPTAEADAGMYGYGSRLYSCDGDISETNEYSFGA